MSALEMVSIENSPNIFVDLKYASTDNFTGRKIYEEPCLFLRSDALEMLHKAADLAVQAGYGGVLVYDGFRPMEAQVFMYKWAQEHNKTVYISDPITGAVSHTKGAAVDLTLLNKDGSTVEMDGFFDDFSSSSHICRATSEVGFNNRMSLLGIMTAAGWVNYEEEWWHYQLPNCNSLDVVDSNDHLVFVTNEVLEIINV